MVNRLVSVATSDGVIVVQTIPSLAPARVDAGAFPEGSEEVSAADRVVDAVEGVRSILRAATEMARVALAAHAPDETTIEVNVGFAGETGIPFLASGSAEAGLKLTLTWRNGAGAAHASGGTGTRAAG